MERRNLAQIKKIGSAVLLILCLLGCTEKEEIPENELLSYPVTLLQTDDAVVTVADKDSDPYVCLSVRRNASERVSSYNMYINDRPVPVEAIDAVLGEVWTDDKILPEGEIDRFSVFVKERGRIYVRFIARYESNEYNCVISYEYE